MYKAVAVIYIACLICYLLVTRVPGYFDGEFVPGIVRKATFLPAEGQPELIIDFPVDEKIYHYKTHKWFLTSYNPGDSVTMIYHPSDPSVACIYTFFGYWIKWSEFIFTAVVFSILFIAAIFITGTNRNIGTVEHAKKRKYDD